MKYSLSDAQKGLNKADKTLNKGFTGWLTRTFMGKDFVNGMNETIASGNQQLNLVERQAALRVNGRTCTAHVVSIEDTGSLINFDPVVQLVLSAVSESGAKFTIEAQSVVSKISVPRPGDMISILYNPADPSVVAVV